MSHSTEHGTTQTDNIYLQNTGTCEADSFNMLQFFKIGTAVAACVELDLGVVSAYDADGNLLSSSQRDQIIPVDKLV